jgi:hypothetical protein
LESPLKVSSNLDDATNERTKACTEAEFPLCLENSLVEMLGAKGRQSIESVLRKNGFERTEVLSPRDVWSLYEKYIRAFASGLGKDVAEVIQFQTTKKIESMRCTSCPLYETELEKLRASALLN